MSFKKILVALTPDSTSKSPVFERALDIAVRNEAKLMLFYCIPQDTVSEMEDSVGGSVTELNQAEARGRLDARHKTLIERQRAWLDGLCQVCTDRGVVINSTVEVGKPSRATVALAKNWGADLVVIGLTKRSALTDWLTSSMTGHVVHHATCSVLLVHE